MRNSNGTENVHLSGIFNVLNETTFGLKTSKKIAVRNCYHYYRKQLHHSNDNIASCMM